MIRIRQIKIPVKLDNEEYLINKVKKILNVKEIKDIIIKKKSIDARLKEIFYIYEVNVLVDNELEIVSILNNKDIFIANNDEYVMPIMGKEKIDGNIVIVGAGPAGLFSAYLLALMGYKPLIIERGKKVEERIEDVNLFWDKNILNPNSNVQFGEGGAGTFSDGKLNTRVKDSYNRLKMILEVFVKFGAPKEILYLQNPHIGTDILRDVIKNMREYIISLGGVFRYNTTLTDLVIKDNKLEAIIVNNNEEIKCHNLILAIGHSARDTFKMLNNYLEMMPKPFAVGLRIMHDEDMINKSQYGDYASIMDAASYKLTYTTKDKRGVYSFCMCPGGFVVNASSEEGRVAINGMSNYQRDSGVSNSAIVVTVGEKDFGTDVFSGLEFQRKLEEKAYKLGNGYIPLQTYQDYVANKVSIKLGNIKPITKGGYTLANLRELFPEYINESIMEAMNNFGHKIKGFDDGDTLIAGVEARTSSPVRILRNEEYEAKIKGIYPCGEGAGYAGGIMSAALDGIKIAEAIIQKYHN